jgi:hypothetical protein
MKFKEINLKGRFAILNSIQLICSPDQQQKFSNMCEFNVDLVNFSILV